MRIISTKDLVMPVLESKSSEDQILAEIQRQIDSGLVPIGTINNTIYNSILFKKLPTYRDEELVILVDKHLLNNALEIWKTHANVFASDKASLWHTLRSCINNSNFQYRIAVKSSVFKQLLDELNSLNFDELDIVDNLMSIFKECCAEELNRSTVWVKRGVEDRRKNV